MLYLAERLNYISLESRDDLIMKGIEISKIINVLIKSMNKS